jgi:hypothetical protein
MEGANEAGRRAARGVLRRLGLDDAGVKLFTFEGLERFDLLRKLDGGLHAFGLPHLFDAAVSAGATLAAAPERIRKIGKTNREARRHRGGRGLRAPRSLRASVSPC